jgi:hypothetical protein
MKGLTRLASDAVHTQEQEARTEVVREVGGSVVAERTRRSDEGASLAHDGRAARDYFESTLTVLSLSSLK